MYIMCQWNIIFFKLCPETFGIFWPCCCFCNTIQIKTHAIIFIIAWSTKYLLICRNLWAICDKLPASISNHLAPNYLFNLFSLQKTYEWKIFSIRRNQLHNAWAGCGMQRPQCVCLDPRLLVEQESCWHYSLGKKKVRCYFLDTKRWLRSDLPLCFFKVDIVDRCESCKNNSICSFFNSPRWETGETDCICCRSCSFNETPGTSFVHCASLFKSFTETHNRGIIACFDPFKIIGNADHLSSSSVLTQIVV